MGIGDDWREREMIEFKSPPFSKDAFQIWMLAVWPKQCESHSRRWKEGREKGMRTKAETNVTEVLLTEKEGGKSYTRLHFVPSVEKNNCKTDFLGAIMTDCNAEKAMELKMNHHYCSGDDGFLSPSWWYEEIHIYYKERILAPLNGIAFL